MEFMEVVNKRRSVRSYSPKQVDRAVIESLLDAAVKAPSGMNTQPWVFGVIQDRALLDDLAERIRKFLLSKVEEWDWLARYKEHLENPESHVFYHAPTLIVIYAKEKGPLSQIDCCLAAENLMLAACDKGLGSCWIGFATWVLDAPETKRELGVPTEYTVIAPIIVGYPASEPPVVEKKPPEILYWR
ncbi:MAG: nitroreductase [Armatimonadetes bacterium]|nr:nitroreductase [Armatimonadota bacterium]